MKTTSSLAYFNRVAQQTPTRFWINNSTAEQCQMALQWGAIGATTNPTYPARLLRDAPDYIHGLIDEAVQKTDNDDLVAEQVYRQAVADLQAVFQRLYKESGGRYGYVAIQGDPRVNDDPDAILEGASQYLEMGDNIIVKVPATVAGAKAMAELVAMGRPTIATLSFSVDQTTYLAQAYEQAAKKANKRPLCYVTFIAGILEDYLLKQSEIQGNPVPDDWIHQAGCAATRVAYRIYQERGYGAVLLGGGARGALHFTQLVGGDLAITIGFDLAQQLVKQNEPVVSRIGDDTPEEVLAALEEHLPDFSKAYHPNSLKPEEFTQFGPVAGFQQSFLKGINVFLAAISERRSLVST